MPAALLAFLFLGSTTWAADHFVKSLKAPMLSEAKNGSKTLQTLERGAKVEGTGQEGSFIKAKASGKEGYINKLFLSDKPVEGKTSMLNQDIDISSKARKRASGFTSAAAARGLKEDSDEVFKALGDADPVALKKMETFHVKEARGVSFVTKKSKQLKKEQK